MRNEEQIVRGIVSYIDNEVMPRMSTAGKWVVGTVSVLMANKSAGAIHSVVTNPIVSALGVVDENGMVDTDSLMNALWDSAGKYGKLYLDIPLIGRMCFGQDDVRILKDYIDRT